MYRPIFALALFLPTVVLAASQKQAPISKPIVDAEPLIAVDFDTSRPQLVAGEGIGVIARIRNVSKTSVYIKETSFALTIPLEMEGSRSGVTGYAAFFPTEIHKAATDTEEFYKFVLKLDPGDTYSVFWTNTFTESSSSVSEYVFHQISSQFQFLFFTPGKYPITLTAKYWTDEKLPEGKYRTLSKDFSILVVAPLFVILFGSAIGGLLAHFVLPQAIPDGQKTLGVISKFARNIVAAFGSMLLSIIVTILISRVSETKFLISVTVNDVWGAVVIGFAANYFGYKILATLFPKKPPEKENSTATNTAT